MKFKNLCVAMIAISTADFAFAIDPVYEGDNGIRAKVFAPTCLQCHSSTLTGSKRNGAPADVNWDTYDSAKAKGARAVVRGVYNKDMPPAFSQLPLLDADQRDALLAWQSAGFPKTSTATGSYSYDTSILTLDIVNAGIFQYKATLKLTPMSSSPTGLGFVLQGADQISDSSDNAAFYSAEIGQVHLPKINLINKGVNQGQVSADLVLVQGVSPLTFMLAYYK